MNRLDRIADWLAALFLGRTRPPAPPAPLPPVWEPPPLPPEKPPAPAPVPVPPAPAPPPAVAPVYDLLPALNAARRSAGLAPFAADPALDAVAGRRAGRMAGNRQMVHYDLSEVAVAVPNRAVGECIAAGQTTPDRVVLAWLSDPPHRALVLGPYTAAGSGVARASDGVLYWCADFAQES